jgi:hypothetical protein
MKIAKRFKSKNRTTPGYDAAWKEVNEKLFEGWKRNS